MQKISDVQTGRKIPVNSRCKDECSFIFPSMPKETCKYCHIQRRCKPCSYPDHERTDPSGDTGTCRKIAEQLGSLRPEILSLFLSLPKRKVLRKWPLLLQEQDQPLWENRSMKIIADENHMYWELKLQSGSRKNELAFKTGLYYWRSFEKACIRDLKQRIVTSDTLGDKPDQPLGHLEEKAYLYLSWKMPF